jgi:hypothetical protein
MPVRRFSPAAWLSAALAWSLLGLAAASEGSTGCATTDARSDAAAALFVLGAAAALAGLVLSVWPFRTRRDLGALGGALALGALALAALGLVMLPLLFAVLLFGIWRIATADGRRGTLRTQALLAYLVSSLWFPAAGIALLWAAMRCFTF